MAAPRLRGTSEKISLSRTTFNIAQKSLSRQETVENPNEVKLKVKNEKIN